MQLTGTHHLTAISANAKGNLDFYTGVLGLRLVKKTVNQDDVSAYHLFYADGVGSPGSDITFFHFPAQAERRGTGAVTRTAFRVSGKDTLDWWVERLDGHRIGHSGARQRDGRWSIHFEDPEGQRLALIDDGDTGVSHPWEKSPVPAEYQIRGLGPATLSVSEPERTDMLLTKVMLMRHVREYALSGGTRARVHVYEMGDGGPAAELHVVAEPNLTKARQGAGGVHHIAFRTPNEDEYKAWADRLLVARVATSGPVDRFYFKSLYFREPSGILFEIATDGPGFATDEPLESLGETLALPPSLEPRRAAIEAGLKPI